MSNLFSIMYKRNNFHPFLLGLIAIALFNAGCSKVDLPKETEIPAAKLFSEGVAIPSEFKWSSVKTVDVRVAVDGRFSGQYFYRIELYDNDPMLGAKANLLGAGMAKQGQDFVGKIVVPTALQYVYLKQISAAGIPSVKMLAVADVTSLTVSKISPSDEVANSALRETTGAATTYNVVVPTDAIQITGSSTVTVESGKSYVIKAGTTFTGQINANNGTNGAKIYVEGIWKNQNYTLDLGNNNAIYITTSGTIELVNVIQNTTGAFLNYGKALFSSLNTSNETLYVNYGTLTADKATLANGSFTNYGTATFQNLSSTTASTKIRNEGSLTVTTASLVNATLEAVCYTKIETLTSNNAFLNVAEKSLLTIGSLDAGGTKFNLASSSILEVTGTAKFNSNKNYMDGTGTGRAVARLKKVDVQNQWQAITYSGNLEIACSEHTPNEQWSTFYILNSPATLVPHDKSTVSIAATSCNGGGNLDKSSGSTPNNQTVTEVNLGTYSYAFEDNWPDAGDYDMNDFVVDMNIIKFQNSDNKITKVVLKGQLRSVGASKRLAAAVQLDGIPTGSIKSVTYSRKDLVGSGFQLGSNGVETGQTYAIATIADDAHKAFGVADTRFISTQDGSFSPVEVVITVEFNTPLDNFTYQALNMFIVSASQNGARNEVHLVGYSASDKVNKSLIDRVKGTKVSLTDPFKSVHNEPWGLCIPVSFISPVEGKNIKDVYPKFESWAVSGGAKDTNWYLEKK